MYKLLIAEDERLERMALEKIIGRNFPNITVLKCAKNGEEAIQFAQQYTPDILLMDIRMPAKNGLEAQKQIIKFHPNIKTVIITAHSEFTYAQEAIKYNVYDFLLKPASPDVLCDCINKILRPPISAIASSNIETPLNQGLIKECISYIEANYLNNIRLTDVASQVHLSEKYFSRFFKEKTGVRFTDYIQILKINRAKNLLTHTDAPIYRVAMELNFSDAAYFTKIFLKHEGVTPNYYRKHHI
ncbi:MAG: response regulator [Clostridia bacterium]|nr:response regulator [Clostridia bacterium]